MARGPGVEKEEPVAAAPEPEQQPGPEPRLAELHSMDRAQLRKRAVRAGATAAQQDAVVDGAYDSGRVGSLDRTLEQIERWIELILTLEGVVDETAEPDHELEETNAHRRKKRKKKKKRSPAAAPYDSTGACNELELRAMYERLGNSSSALELHIARTVDLHEELHAFFEGVRLVRECVRAGSVRACPGRLSALRVFHSKSVLYGAYGRAGHLTVKNGGFRPGQVLPGAAVQLCAGGKAAAATARSCPRCPARASRCPPARAVGRRDANPGGSGGAACPLESSLCPPCGPSA